MPGCESIRNRLHEVARKKGKKYLYNLLRKKDIETAERLKEGDLVTTPPYEIHALKILDQGNEFFVFFIK